MKTFLGILIMLIGVLGGGILALLFLVWGIMDIVAMAQSHIITFWGLFWAIAKISLRDFLAIIVIFITWIIGTSLMGLKRKNRKR